jgi:alpha-beta hydrolase superfamily lysophospholipase
MSLVMSACIPQVNPAGRLVVEAKLEKEYFVARDGAMLPLRSWLPEDNHVKAVIVALHGFNDYSNAFTSPGAFLSRHGIACYAYDQRGFGKAPGRGLWAGIDAYTNDLATFVKEIRKRHPGIPLYVLGESMGGAVTIVAVTGNNPPDTDGIILVAPAVWGRDTMPWHQRWLLAVASHTIPWMEFTGEGLNISPSDNSEIRRGLHSDPFVIKKTRVDSMYGLTNLMDEALAQAAKLQLPVLVQYGKKDQVIPKEPTFIMLGTMSKTTRKAFYQNGYHMLLRDIEGDKPLVDIISWIYDRNSPLPFSSDTWN